MMNFAVPSPSSSSAKAISSAPVGAYVVLIISGASMFHFIAAGAISSVLTIGAMVQTFAFVLLAIQIASAGHARGISARALVLNALALTCRLSATVSDVGYLPADASGDWFYQAVDFCSLALILWLAYQTVVVHKDTYQEADDTFPAIHAAVGAVALAFIFHPHEDHLFLLDTLWMASRNINAIAVLPQFWLIARVGGRMEALTTHFIAALAISELFNAIFTWFAWDHISCDPWIQGVNHGILAMAFAHVVHVILLGDFIYHYTRSLAKGGIASNMDLSSTLSRSSPDTSLPRTTTNLVPSPCSSLAKSIPSASVLVAYLLLFISGATMYHHVAGKASSSILTMGAMVQAFAFALLGMQIVSAGHARGISARALALDALALICRLSSTVWQDGYLPVDASGDWLYQAVDICCLALVLWLISQVVVVHKDTYQEADDTFPVIHAALGAVAFALLFHPNEDHIFLFDSLWMAGRNINAIAVLPQLWLTVRAGGRMEALTSHYIAALAISELFNAMFTWLAWGHIECNPWIQGVNHGILAMAFAHLVHVILLSDFAYYYIRSMVSGGISSNIHLGGGDSRSSPDDSSQSTTRNFDFKNTQRASVLAKNIPSASVLVAYVLLFISGAVLYHHIAAKEMSSVLTMGAIVQTFAFVLLGIQIASTGHARGISARALVLNALALICRLPATVSDVGYLPADASGDWIYQAVEFSSLALVLCLAYQVVVVHKDTYQEADDTFPAIHVALGAVALALIFHPNEDQVFLLDSLWMASRNISAIAVLPQFWLSARVGGRMEALTTHYIAALGATELCSMTFTWYAWDHITCQPWIQGVNHGILAMAFAHVVHVILLSDFAYHYVRSLVKGGISSSMSMSNGVWV